jgi:hypothetical protein
MQSVIFHYSPKEDRQTDDLREVQRQRALISTGCECSCLWVRDNISNAYAELSDKIALSEGHSKMQMHSYSVPQYAIEETQVRCKELLNFEAVSMENAVLFNRYRI